MIHIGPELGCPFIIVAVDRRQGPLAGDHTLGRCVAVDGAGDEPLPGDAQRRHRLGKAQIQRLVHTEKVHRHQRIARPVCRENSGYRAG